MGKFSNLHLEHWDSEALSVISSVIGHHINPDGITASMERINYARILINVTTAYAFPSQVAVKDNGVIHVMFKWNMISSLMYALSGIYLGIKQKHVAYKLHVSTRQQKTLVNIIKHRASSLLCIKRVIINGINTILWTDTWINCTSLVDNIGWDRHHLSKHKNVPVSYIVQDGQWDTRTQ